MRRSAFILVPFAYFIIIASGCAPADRADPRVRPTVSQLIGDTVCLTAEKLAWINRVIEPFDRDRIVTVYTEPIVHWVDCFTIMDRRVEGDRVIATLYTHWRDEEDEAETVYDITHPEAAAMFRNLHRQVAMGFGLWDSRSSEEMAYSARSQLGVRQALRSM